MTAPSFNVSREFSLPTPSDEGQRLAEEISELFTDLADFLATNLPAGRLKSLTMTELQSAFSWACKSAALDTEDGA